MYVHCVLCIAQSVINFAVEKFMDIVQNLVHIDAEPIKCVKTINKSIF